MKKLPEFWTRFMLPLLMVIGAGFMMAILLALLGFKGT